MSLPLLLSISTSLYASGPVPAMQTQPQFSAPSPTASSAGRQQTLTLPARQQPPIVDTALSRRTSEHLHHERLPYVDAQVLRGDRGEANSVVLTGQVHTAFGKQDAERKVRAFLGESPLAIKNQISVVGEIPEHPKASASQNEMDLEPALLGCWRGTNARDDTERWLGACGRMVRVPVTYKLCFQRSEDDLEITFQNSGSPLSKYEDRTHLVSSEGRESMVLSSVGSYDNSAGHITYSWKLNCNFVGSRNVLACRSSGSQDCNGRPWMRQTWHFALERVAR